MRVLLTGSSLAVRAGSDDTTRALARLLLSRGHRVMVYGSDWAQLARSVEIDVIPVAADLARLTQIPDIIHALHPHDAISAMAALPDVPALCQIPNPSAWNWLPRHPRLYRLLWAGEITAGPCIGRHRDFSGHRVVQFDQNAPDAERAIALESLYQEILSEHHGRQTDWPGEAKAILAYLQGCYPELKEVDHRLECDWRHVDRFLWAKHPDLRHLFGE